ncbi:MAG: hypothetical protein IK139_03755 [Lachnospiraceae bacterium]|nr:hypothetical protein [Lachnospiraceae bacterium]
MDSDGLIRETEKTTQLSFESFDGGGPEFDVVIGDESIVSYERSRTYSSPDHETEDGAGYTVRYSFKGLKPGETYMTIMERSPIADNLDHLYKVSVDEDLHVKIELQGTTNIDEKRKTSHMFSTQANAFAILTPVSRK